MKLSSLWAIFALLMMVLSISIPANAGIAVATASMQVDRYNTATKTWAPVTGYELHVGLGDTFRVSCRCNLSDAVFSPVQYYMHDGAALVITKSLAGLGVYTAAKSGSVSFYGLATEMANDVPMAVRVYIDAPITIFASTSQDPDYLHTVTTTIYNTTGQATSLGTMAKLTATLNGQFLSETASVGNSTAVTSVVIPNGWQIRAGSTWMTSSDPSYKGWVWTQGILSGVNFGSIPAKGWVKVRFRLEPISLVTVDVVSSGVIVPSDHTGYRVLVDSQHYSVVAHFPGQKDSNLSVTLGNRYNPEYSARTLAWLSGPEFWCEGPGCNEIVAQVWDRTTGAKLGELIFPVRVPEVDLSPGKG